LEDTCLVTGIPIGLQVGCQGPARTNERITRCP